MFSSQCHTLEPCMKHGCAAGHVDFHNFWCTYNEVWSIAEKDTIMTSAECSKKRLLWGCPASYTCWQDGYRILLPHCLSFVKILAIRASKSPNAPRWKPPKIEARFDPPFGPKNTLSSFFSPKCRSNVVKKSRHMGHLVLPYTNHPLIPLNRLCIYLSHRSPDWRKMRQIVVAGPVVIS